MSEVMERNESDSTAPVPARRFGDDDVRRILQRAAELQERSDDVGPGSGRGLTLDELRAIAAEAGIDPKYVEMAARQGSGAGRTESHPLIGADHSWEVESTVPGEIDDADRERILEAARSIMGMRGEVDHVFGRTEVTFDSGTGPVILGVSSRDGTTRVAVSAAKVSEAGLSFGLMVPFGGIMGGAIIASGIGVSGPAVLPIMGTLAVAAYGAARLGWRARSRWWSRKVRDLLEGVTVIVQDAATLPGSDASPAALPASDEAAAG